MDGFGEEGGIRLSKRFSDSDNKAKAKAGSSSSAEVDFKTKSGTAWSHSYLNQKPWHPLSYPNQRRKWIAEQTHAQRMRRSEEVAREYAQEQEFFRQTALISKKDKEKMDMMKAVSFMYVRPPGYNAESAKAAEISDERKRVDNNNNSTSTSTSMQPESLPAQDVQKPRAKDIYGRPLPTEQEFEILKNAPRLETGVLARVKPFGVEVRNVKCLRCGNYGHQSGDRECPLKDTIMPNEESRLKRDDPLTTIMAQMDATEPLKWELKQKPGMSPPRGGFQPDDPNQQIVAEDIFDEYGGFLSGGNIPDLLSNFSCKPKKRKSSKKGKHKTQSSLGGIELEFPDQRSYSPLDDGERQLEKKIKKQKKRQNYCGSSSSDCEDIHRHQRKRGHKRTYLEVSDEQQYRTKASRERRVYTSEDSEPDLELGGEMSKTKHSYSHKDGYDRHHGKSKRECCYPSEDSEPCRHDRRKESIEKPGSKKSGKKHYFSSEYDRNIKDERSMSGNSGHKHFYSSNNVAGGRYYVAEMGRYKHSSHQNKDSECDAKHRRRFHH